jgi:AbrB family looped-hinge helix DNA binding protein
MNMHTKLSAKGQVVLPNVVRQQLGWDAGKGLEVLVHGDAVTLRPIRTRLTSSPADVFKRLEKIGPVSTERLTDEEMDRLVIAQAMLRYPPR